MALDPAAHRPFVPARSVMRLIVLVSLLWLAGCVEGIEPLVRSPKLSNAVAVRDAACYDDFTLNTEAVEAKLANSINDISSSISIADDNLRADVILGLQLNANLQKRLAFESLRECLD